MSYKTFTIEGNKLIIDEPTKSTKGIAHTGSNQRYKTLPPETSEEESSWHQGGYGHHELAEDEAIILDDDIYFA